MPSTDTRVDETHQLHAGNGAVPGQILICDLNLHCRVVALPDLTPVGSQVAIAAGFTPDQQASVIQWREQSLEDVSPNEPINLGDGGNRFIVLESDGMSRFTVDGARFDWPARQIPTAVVRKLAGVAPEKGIYLERQNEADQLLDDSGILELSGAGVERLASRALKWQLDVQGVRLTLSTPMISVRDALLQANINPDQGWLIFLKIKDRPKESLTLASVVDLRRPGIEKIRLTPSDVSNGDGTAQAFNMLSLDEAFLNANHPGWRTHVEGGRQWLILAMYRLPPGYSASEVSLALEIPPTYPSAQIDMFYLLPGVTLVSGGQIPATESPQQINGQQYQRWSRHRGGGSPWQMAHDNVRTHMALVESALLKEVQQ